MFWSRAMLCLILTTQSIGHTPGIENILGYKQYIHNDKKTLTWYLHEYYTPHSIFTHSRHKNIRHLSIHALSTMRDHGLAFLPCGVLILGIIFFCATPRCFSRHSIVLSTAAPASLERGAVSIYYRAFVVAGAEEAASRSDASECARWPGSG